MISLILDILYCSLWLGWYNIVPRFKYLYKFFHYVFWFLSFIFEKDIIYLKFNFCFTIIFFSSFAFFLNKSYRYFYPFTPKTPPIWLDSFCIFGLLLEVFNIITFSVVEQTPFCSRCSLHQTVPALLHSLQYILVH